MTTPIQVKVPVENVNDLTAKLLSRKVDTGMQVTRDQVLAELETTKATFELLAPSAGFVQFMREIEEEIPVGDVVCLIHSSWPPSPSPTAASASERDPDPLPGASAASSDPTAVDVPVATPSVSPGCATPSKPTVFSRRAQDLLQRNALPRESFVGQLFVREADVKDRVSAAEPSSPAPHQPPSSGTPARLESAAESPPTQLGEIVPLERAKLFENRELEKSARFVLKSTLHYRCTAAGLGARCAAQSPPIQRLAIILFEASRLLRSFRLLNACFHRDAAFVYQDINLGFAVDLERGLKVLVIHRADTLTFDRLSERLDELLGRYVDNRLQIKDVTGATFTVTDLSQTGVQCFDPLLNAGQSAILGVGSDMTEPGGGGAFILSCAFDHRITSGKLVADFLGQLARRLEAHARSLQLVPCTPAELACSRCRRTAAELRAEDHQLLPSVEPPGHICSICLNGY